MRTMITACIVGFTTAACGPEDGEGCRETFDPQGRVHLEVSSMDPSRATGTAAIPNLAPVSLVYFVAENNFVGIEPAVDDVPYVAIQPDRPCE